MNSLRLINKRTGHSLLTKVRVAKSPLARIKGLLFTKDLKLGHGLHLLPCNGIHTIGMQYAIDALYLDQKNRVVHILKALEPNHIGPVVMRAHSIVELPAHSINGDEEVTLGDELTFQSVPSVPGTKGTD